MVKTPEPGKIQNGPLCQTGPSGLETQGTLEYKRELTHSHASPPVRETNSEKIMSTTATPPKGLEGIVAANSAVCYIDGDAGVLAYRGIDIHELADNSNFEETCYLLWFGKLPTRAELAA